MKSNGILLGGYLLIFCFLYMFSNSFVISFTGAFIVFLVFGTLLNFLNGKFDLFVSVLIAFSYLMLFSAFAMITDSIMFASILGVTVFMLAPYFQKYIRVNRFS